ncbi:phosphatidylinositol-glycan biosynthesis class F protein isoform X1 [Cynara cardunculus var. scolymus]|uniref:phosphatidylinositol-glycan biosynthesis class F protein isoform X1 n=1 Tax=Cynara cardunculus var. scolymus TaxID=59895 RepID=UPI000D62450D|nr:phosphatidylinositol-glycan biosynthesis class F protein isoform X1 [Cynara cardunculus var. scolymus]
MKNKKKGHNIKDITRGDAVVQNLSPSKVLLSHLICGIGLASSFWLAINIYSINLIDNPASTLRLIWLIEVPVVVLLYSLFRKDMNQSSFSFLNVTLQYLKAVARGLLGLPVGAVVHALGAIVLGAPVGTQYFLRTLNWSLLMSTFTFVPAASVYGSSWVDWHRIFAQTKPIGSIDYMICLPAHGAVIGGWFGAWPMPLDWERTWQEWPICVTYGAIIGYLVGMLASFCSAVFRVSSQHVKGD